MPKRNKTEANPLPVSDEAERAVLGAILLDNQCYYETALTLRDTDFALDSHRRIYRAILELDCNSRPFDYVTLSEVLTSRGEMEAIGGVSYLTSLTDGLPRVSNIQHYCDIIAEYARRRRLIQVADVARARAIDLAEPITETLATAQHDVLDIAASSHKVKAHKVDEYIGPMFDAMRQQAEQPKNDNLLGLTFGFEAMDIETGGAMPRECVVIAGYSGDGKSIMAKQMIYANLMKDVPCLVFTQEMTKEQYLRRMVPEATNGWLPGYAMRDLRGLSSEMRSYLDVAETKLRKLPLWTVDASTVQVSEMLAISRSMIRREKIQLIVLDFLQLIAAAGAVNDADRVSQGSAALRALAKDEGVVSVAVSQVTPAERGRKIPPNMFVLRQSGDIAQNAHIIAFVYRPENQKGYFTGKDQLRIGKMREGSGRMPFPVELDRNTLKWVHRDTEKGTTVDDEEQELSSSMFPVRKK